MHTVGSKKRKIVIHLVLILCVIITFLPAIWGFVCSFKESVEMFSRPLKFFPEIFRFDNYSKAWMSGNFIRSMVNSLIVSTASTFGMLLICALAGYALAKFQFKGRNLFFMTVLATMMVPMQVTMVPVFGITTRFGLIDTYLGLILPLLAYPYGIFLMRQFMMSLPDALIEAARIEGCSEFTVFARIVIPLSKPIMSTLGILAFLDSWNQLVWPLILTKSPKMMTVQLALKSFKSEFGMKWNLVMAATFISIIPVTLVFAFFQKQSVEGIATSGLKG